MSVRNPQHELMLKAFIENKYDLPVICGHELTNTLGAHERAVTATLNARLIPVIKELVLAVKQTMREEQIDAPLMIVRGDGSLVTAETALERPIETMLSGPAASIIGARYLTSLHHAIVVDMGGTTTDTAIIHDGLPLLNPNGATVGGFLTRVKAVDIHTVGFGGDSHLQFNDKEGLKIGPQRVMPLSVAALEHPHIPEELSSLLNANHKNTRYQPTEFIFLTKKGRISKTIPEAIKDMLADGPHSILYLGQRLSTNPAFWAIDHWKTAGLLSAAGLTPTDFKVAKGEAKMGNREAAELAVELTGQVFSLTDRELYQLVDQKIDQTICDILLTEAMGNKPAYAQIHRFLAEELFNKSPQNYELSLKLKLPVVAVGAPVEAYYPRVMRALEAELVIPPHAEVANAVGAITGQVVEQVELTIRPDSCGYILYTPWEKISYPHDDLETIKDMATTFARNYVLEQAKKNGGHHIDVFCEVEDVRVNTVLSAEQRYYLEGKVRARAIGNAYRSYLQ